MSGAEPIDVASALTALFTEVNRDGCELTGKSQAGGSSDAVGRG
jgi:hypothetical protein